MQVKFQKFHKIMVSCWGKSITELVVRKIKENQFF